MHTCVHVGAIVLSGMASDFRGNSQKLLVHLQYSSQTLVLQVLIAASLEPFGARRMLPCLDFPNLKANFSISIQAPENLVALSNMAEESLQPGLEPGTTLHKFGVTPKMSTYLMGVTVGHMVSTSAMSNSGKQISVWSVPALGDQHAVPLQVIEPSLSVGVHACPQ